MSESEKPNNLSLSSKLQAARKWLEFALAAVPILVGSVDMAMAEGNQTKEKTPNFVRYNKVGILECYQDDMLCIDGDAFFYSHWAANALPLNRSCECRKEPEMEEERSSWFYGGVKKVPTGRTILVPYVSDQKQE